MSSGPGIDDATAAEMVDNAYSRGYEQGYDDAKRELLPHINHLAKQIGGAPAGNLTVQVEGIGMGAEQAQM